MPLPQRKHIPLRLSSDWDERLQAIAERNGLTKQGWVMNLVREAIEAVETEVVTTPKGKKEKARISSTSSTERPGLGIANIFANSSPVTEEPPSPPKIPAGVNVYVGSTPPDARPELERLATYVAKVDDPERESRLRVVKKILHDTCKDDFEYQDVLHRFDDLLAKHVQARGESPLKGFWNGVQRLLS